MPDTRKTLRQILLAAAAALVSLLIAEAVVRALSPADSCVWPPNTVLINRPEPGTIRGVGPEARFEINSAGIRGDEFSDSRDYHILAVGGSSTECLYLDTDKAWPYALQQMLNAQLQGERVWVGNIGRSGPGESRAGQWGSEPRGRLRCSPIAHQGFQAQAQLTPRCALSTLKERG